MRSIERLRIKELQRQIAERRKVLEEIQKRSNGHQLPGDHTSQLKAWQRTHKMTVGTRRILVKEVTSLFELRPGVIEESEVAASPSPPLYEMPPFSQTEDTTEGKEDLYICGVTLPTRLIDVSSKHSIYIYRLILTCGFRIFEGRIECTNWFSNPHAWPYCSLFRYQTTFYDFSERHSSLYSNDATQYTTMDKY